MCFNNNTAKDKLLDLESNTHIRCISIPRVSQNFQIDIETIHILDVSPSYEVLSNVANVVRNNTHIRRVSILVD